MKLFSTKKLMIQKGFTLVELLIVIAILGVLAAGMMVAIDPVDKIFAANDAKVQNDVASLGKAAETYAASHEGVYPNGTAIMITTREIKSVPVPPSGYGVTLYTFTPKKTDDADAVTDCGTGEVCDHVVVTGPLKSKKFTVEKHFKFWRYESSTGKSCGTFAEANTCDLPLAGYP